MNNDYRFFIAGIMQGSEYDQAIHDQGYRNTIKNILSKHFPPDKIYCPVENYPDSISYDDQKAQSVFDKHLGIVRNSDCIVSYLPEASMGSAIEMWEAYRNQIVVVTISPMTENWVVRILSDYICTNLDEFNQFVDSGKLLSLLESRIADKKIFDSKMK